MRTRISGDFTHALIRSQYRVAGPLRAFLVPATDQSHSRGLSSGSDRVRTNDVKNLDRSIVGLLNRCTGASPPSRTKSATRLPRDPRGSPRRGSAGDGGPPTNDRRARRARAEGPTPRCDGGPCVSRLRFPFNWYRRLRPGASDGCRARRSSRYCLGRAPRCSPGASCHRGCSRISSTP